jgi:hypothetical protein
MSHVTKNLLRHWRMKLKLQLRTHQSNAQLKIQVFVMIHSVGPLKCWELLAEWHIYHITEHLTFSSVIVTSDDIVNSYLCKAQPLDMHVKGRDGGLHHGLGIIYQTLIQMTFWVLSLVRPMYVCVNFPDHKSKFSLYKRWNLGVWRILGSPTSVSHVKV